MEAGTIAKGKRSEPVPVKPPSENGLYVWEIYISYYYRESDNFYPGSANTKWKVGWQENKSNLEIQLRVTNVEEVPVRFVFTIQSKRFTLILKEKGDKNYDISQLNVKELQDTKNEKKGCDMEVRWCMEKFTSTKDFPEVLVRDFGSLLDSGKFSDVEIETENGSRIPAHRGILSARSSVFCAMLESDMLETKTRCIKITDFPAQTVKNLVKYMYTGRLPKFSCECATELLKIAEKYNFVDLKRACADSLSLHIGVFNVVKMLVLADVYDESSLKKKTLDFICKNLASFKVPSMFDSSVKQRPDLLVEVINSIAKSKP